MSRFGVLAFLSLAGLGAWAEDPVNLYWKHPKGDTATTPCVHLKKEHPDGCPGPCTCPAVVQHPNGDTKTVPCVHLKLAHPDGHDTGRKVPCVHPTRTGPKHPNGDPVMEPCTHSVVEHPDGDKVSTPCIHLGLKHPDGEPGTKVPCLHLKPEHPDGDSQTVPCVHPLKKYRSESDPPLDFYFSDTEMQEAMITAVRQLKNMGVKFTWPKPLSCFYREPINGDPDDNGDPFWSHYDPVPHALVVTRDPKDYRPAGADAPDFDMEKWRRDRLESKKDTLRHELGHSLMKMKCVKISSKNGKHEMEKETDEGTAMSEGWANFVAAVLQNSRNADKAYRKGYEIENASRSTAPMNQKVEYRVTAILWDLYDNHGGRGESWDTVSIDFEDLFKVFSPSLETLTKGPTIKDLDGYLQRLKKNLKNDSDVDAVVRGNGL